MPIQVFFVGRLQGHWVVRAAGANMPNEFLPVAQDARADEAMAVAQALYPDSMIAVTKFAV